MISGSSIDWQQIITQCECTCTIADEQMPALIKIWYSISGDIARGKIVSEPKRWYDSSFLTFYARREVCQFPLSLKVNEIRSSVVAMLPSARRSSVPNDARTKSSVPSRLKSSTPA